MENIGCHVGCHVRLSMISILMFFPDIKNMGQSTHIKKARCRVASQMKNQALIKEGLTKPAIFLKHSQRKFKKHFFILFLFLKIVQFVGLATSLFCCRLLLRPLPGQVIY